MHVKLTLKRFREIADSVGAYLMVDMAHIAGLVASGYHESPIPYAHVTTTTTHKTLRGPRGGMILSSKEFAEEHKLNKSLFPGIQGGPLMHVIAAKAVCFKEALDPSFKEYGKNIIDNAQALCKGLMERGIKIVSGGTDNHLMLVDLADKGLTGKEVEKWLDEAHITCNKILFQMTHSHHLLQAEYVLVQPLLQQGDLKQMIRIKLQKQ